LDQTRRRYRKSDQDRCQRRPPPRESDRAGCFAMMVAMVVTAVSVVVT
jgi:hypothetical protein